MHEHIDTIFRSQLSRALVKVQTPDPDKLNIVPQVFRVDTSGLFTRYLNSLPEEVRGQYKCSCCEQFVRRFGGLVTVGDDGRLNSVLWNEITEESGFHFGAATTLAALVQSRPVKSLFRSDLRILGKATTGNWKHMHLFNEQKVDAIHEAKSFIGKAEQNFQLTRQLSHRYSAEHVDKAIAIARASDKNRPRTVLPALAWLKALIEIRQTAQHLNRDQKHNLTWKISNDVPPSYPRLRSGLTGFFLDMVVDGKLSDSQIIDQLAEKSSSDVYMRPIAAPKEGNIERGEKIIERLGLASSLPRRAARLEDVKPIWTPPIIEVKEPENEGVFHSIRAKPTEKKVQKAVIEKVVPITLTKFMNKILPETIDLKYRAPTQDIFCAMVTAVDPDSVPILKWDNPDNRNTVSAYTYHGVTSRGHWNLADGFTTVNAIVRVPHHRDQPQWNVPDNDEADSFHFNLEGCRDLRNPSSCLFPEILRHELHEVRATIEKFSKSTPLIDTENSTTGGVRVGRFAFPHGTFRVETADSVSFYRIDRWE